MPEKPVVVAMDLEGVLVPEIWIAVAEQTGLDELKLTTRDVSDYDELMQNRLAVLHRNNLKLSDIRAVIEQLAPLEGARQYTDWVREHYELILLSGTFYEFAKPLMAKLNWPTLFCNRLEIDDQDNIANYWLRQKRDKANAVEALQNLNFRVMAVGDSYNDTDMLEQADLGILFRSPDNLKQQFPQFQTAEDHYILQKITEEFAGYV